MVDRNRREQSLSVSTTPYSRKRQQRDRVTMPFPHLCVSYEGCATTGRTAILYVDRIETPVQRKDSLYPLPLYSSTLQIMGL